ncbi:MAG: hypothetical protein ACRDAG_08670 [Cetobacterium somerae]|uniref:hypothetical protein n=1 Tax=Cetobacterium TaxID=180162 RepID=UPI0026250B3D|nr:hypothetical protein [uncultured Cetobacterium sp.]
MEKFSKRIEKLLVEIGSSLEKDEKVSIQITKEMNGKIFYSIAPTKIIGANE